MFKFIVLLSFLFTTLFAQQNGEEFHFIGFTASTDSMDFDSIAETGDQDETTFGLRYGRQTLDWRTVFTISGNSDLQTFAVEVDKILVDALFGMPEIRPYLGATVGYLHYDNPYTSDSDGYYYGGNFGLLFYATDTIDVDLSYHYYGISKLDPFDTMQGASLSIHFFY
jgi:hypothetical protein